MLCTGLCCVPGDGPEEPEEHVRAALPWGHWPDLLILGPMFGTEMVLPRQVLADPVLWESA